MACSWRGRQPEALEQVHKMIAAKRQDPQQAHFLGRFNSCKSWIKTALSNLTMLR
jgi:hypothetical protein